MTSPHPSPATAVTPLAPGSRPRVEGDREREILEVAGRILADVGYDRLTMDAVAIAARAGKATLYRRWHTKATLVIDALLLLKGPHDTATDTGSLRGDLLAIACGPGGLSTKKPVDTMASVITALHRDEEFAAQFRERVIGPKLSQSEQAFERARLRGEIGPDIDVALLAPALAGIVLHRVFVLGLPAGEATISRIIDEIVIPAATRTASRPTEKDNP